MSDSFVTPWTIACQAPLSMGFSMQEYWSGLPFPSPDGLPNLGIKPAFPVTPVLAGRLFYQYQRPKLGACHVCSAQIYCVRGLPHGATGKEPTCQCRRLKRGISIPGSGRSPGGGNGNPLQYSYLGNPMDRGARRATVPGVTKSQT